jgi:hypothetical protein
MQEAAEHTSVGAAHKAPNTIHQHMSSDTNSARFGTFDFFGDAACYGMQEAAEHTGLGAVHKSPNTIC